MRSDEYMGEDTTIPGKGGGKQIHHFNFFADFQKNSIAVLTSSWFPRRQRGGGGGYTYSKDTWGRGVSVVC